MIVPMKRLTLVALKADEEAILQALQRTGTVEVISQADVSDEKTGDEQLLSQVQRFESAAQLLKRYGEKPPMGPKPEMSAEELFASMPESVALMERTEELDKTLAAARSEIEKKETLIETLLPWERLDARIEDIHATRSVRYAVGFCPFVRWNRWKRQALLWKRSPARGRRRCLWPLPLPNTMKCSAR